MDRWMEERGLLGRKRSSLSAPSGHRSGSLMVLSAEVSAPTSKNLCLLGPCYDIALEAGNYLN